MIYLDSSALLKLLHEEPESAALAKWLSEHADRPMITSELAKVEVVRACRRLDADTLPAARSLLAQLDLIPLTSDLVDDAGDTGDTTLRSLDAIHLASARSIEPHLTGFIAYDRRLGAAATAAGLALLTPGRTDPMDSPGI